MKAAGHIPSVLSALESLVSLKLTVPFLCFQESFEGQMTEENIEVGICTASGFRRLPPAEVKDYLASVL